MEVNRNRFRYPIDLTWDEVVLLRGLIRNAGCILWVQDEQLHRSLAENHPACSAIPDNDLRLLERMHHDLRDFF